MADRYDRMEEDYDKLGEARRGTRNLELAAYFIVWLMAVGSFHLAGTGNEMGYKIVSFYIVIPLITLIISFVIGRDKGWGPARWWMPFLSGAMFAAALAVTFGIADGNIMSYGKDYLILFAAGAGLSIIGIAAGLIMNRRKEKQME